MFYSLHLRERHVGVKIAEEYKQGGGDDGLQEVLVEVPLQGDPGGDAGVGDVILSSVVLTNKLHLMIKLIQSSTMLNLHNIVN